MSSLSQRGGSHPLAVDVEQADAPADKHFSIASLTRWPVLAIAAGTGLLLLLTSGRVGYFDTVTGAYRALPPATRRTTAVVTYSYWDASALDRYGPARGPPQDFNPNRGYWYFGAPADDADAVLFVGSDPTYLHRYFTEVRQVATVTTGRAMNLFSLATPIWLCSGQRAPWSQLWPQLRHL